MHACLCTVLFSISPDVLGYMPSPRWSITRGTLVALQGQVRTRLDSAARMKGKARRGRGAPLLPLHGECRAQALTMCSAQGLLKSG